MNFFQKLRHKPLKLWPYFAAAAAGIGGGIAASSFIAGSSVAVAGGAAAGGAAIGSSGGTLIGSAAMSTGVATSVGNLGIGAKLASAAKSFSGLVKSSLPLVTNFFSGTSQNSSVPEEAQSLMPYTGISGTINEPTLIPVPINQSSGGNGGFFMPSSTETQEAGFDFSSIFRMPYILIIAAIGILLFMRMKRG